MWTQKRAEMTKRAQFSALPLVSSVLRSTRCRHAVFASCLLVLIFCFLYFFTRGLTGKFIAWKRLEFAIRISPIRHLVCPPPAPPPKKKMLHKNFLQSTQYWDACNAQEKLTETKVMQNLAGGGEAQTKCVIRVVQMANSRLFFGQTVSQFACPGPLLAYLS